MSPQGSARIAYPIAFGLVSALMFLSLTRGIPNAVMLGFLSPLPLMAAALGLGTVSTVCAVAIGAVACALVSELPHAVAFLALSASPALVVSSLALRQRHDSQGAVQWYPAGHVLAWLSVAAAGMVLMFIYFAAGRDGGFRSLVDTALNQWLDTIGGDITPEQRASVVQTLSSAMPSLMMMAWLMMATVNAVVAQAVLSWLGQAKRPPQLYRDLELPVWLPGLPVTALVVLAIAPTSAAFVAAGVAVVGMMPFSALGIVWVHQYLSERPYAVIGLTAFYGALALFTVWVLAPLSVAGAALFVRSLIARRKAGSKES